MTLPNLMQRMALVLPLALGGLTLAASPAMAQVVVRNVPISDADLGRVKRQCDALRYRELRSLADDDGEPPAAGVIISDPANAWATGADGTDSALAGLDLGRLTIADCRRAGL